MSREIEKITVSLPAETLRIADENHRRFGFENRSEFINAAIREYVNRDLLREFGSEIAEVYSKIQHSEIRNLEEHLSKLSYKIAVEIAQMNLFLASIMEALISSTSKAMWSIWPCPLDLISSSSFPDN